MSAIKDLVYDYNNMCGESETEMGDAALGELSVMLAKLAAASKLEDAAYGVIRCIPSDMNDETFLALVELNQALDEYRKARER